MAKDKMITCKHCGQEIAASAKVCPHCGGKNKPPIYKRWWFIAIIVLVILYAIGSSGSSSSSSSSSSVASSSKTESSASSVAVSNTAVSEPASSTAASAPSEPEISEDEYKAACETIKYKDLCRYPDQYVGTKISITVKVQQIMDAANALLLGAVMRVDIGAPVGGKTGLNGGDKLGQGVGEIKRTLLRRGSVIA